MEKVLFSKANGDKKCVTFCFFRESSINPITVIWFYSNFLEFV